MSSANNVVEYDDTTIITSTYYGKEPCVQKVFKTMAYTVGSMRGKAGVDTPNYYKLIRSGALLPFTPYDKYEIASEIESTFDSYSTTGSCSCMPCRHYWADNGYLHTSVPSSLGMDKDQVINAAISHLGEGVSVNDALASIYDNGWDALTFAAEFEGTISMFTNLLRRFNTSFTLRCARSDPNNWENIWLEYRYGWRTLYFDIRDFAKAMKRKDGIKRYIGRSSTTLATSSIETENLSGINWNGRTVVTTTETIKPRLSVVMDVLIPRIWINPIQTGWELVPYSFVVDWFINVGSYLKALAISALATRGVAGSGVLYEIEKTWDFAATSYKPYGGFNWGGQWDAKRTTTASVTYRVPISAGATLPRITPNVNVSRLIDAIALLKQVFK